MCYLWYPKIVEGIIFRGRDIIQNLLSDLDLGGPDDLRPGLRGHLRPSEAKIGFFYFLVYSTSRSFCLSTQLAIVIQRGYETMKYNVPN